MQNTNYPPNFDARELDISEHDCKQGEEQGCAGCAEYYEKVCQKCHWVKSNCKCVSEFDFIFGKNGENLINPLGL
jgi:hypothetical protein